MLRDTKPVEVISKVGCDELGKIFDPRDLEGVIFDSSTGVFVNTRFSHSGYSCVHWDLTRSNLGLSR